MCVRPRKLAYACACLRPCVRVRVRVCARASGWAQPGPCASGCAAAWWAWANLWAWASERAWARRARAPHAWPEAGTSR
eukprot:5108779-Pleurochrysis_carterae.AAC.1